MRSFAELYTRMDATTKTGEKVAALRAYFAQAAPEDAAWAIYFLVGNRPRQVVPTRKLAGWGAELAGVPDWLFDECYEAVGDLAETISLLLPEPERTSDRPLHEWIEEWLLTLRGADEETQRTRLREAWAQMDHEQRLVWNKLITGSFRVGVAQQLVVRGLSETSGVPAATITHRLMGNWQPSADFVQRLLAPETPDADLSRPYPFFLAHPLEDAPAALGQPQDWQAEWKWDGIRAQLIRRNGKTFLWSRGEELITEKYPELLDDAAKLPDGTVLDGELLAWKHGRALPFAQLQKRIGRKQPGKKILQDVPVALLAFDLLEVGGQDLRDRELRHRRTALAELIGKTSGLTRILLSSVFQEGDWGTLAQRREESRSHQVEGLMLKRLDAPYGVGRQRGAWWKWKIAPFTIDAVLIYAQAGHGRRASLFTDYTFGVWHEGTLVPFAKAYSGLTDAEIRQVDRFIRDNTLERFGPVRSVKPELVFELAFENIQRSSRHKSGVAVRFPRIARWRHDKKIEDADSLEQILAMLPES
ncbi:MAG TPA: ATP-dependent DNA ligase [Planctomycetaceae bacterium]|nr:ATP-dependent DNA ligase [Planctomycetaceae bacterium]